MQTLLDDISAKAKFTKQVHCIDTAITFASTNEELLPLFTGPLEYFLPSCQNHTQGKSSQVTCTLAPASIIDNWPESLEAGYVKKTEISDSSIGDATLLSTDSGACLVLKKIGSIYHSGDGNFLCLVNSAKEPSGGENFPNVNSLCTALISEILILSNKLLIHGGAVGKAGECQIWTGESGSGKTTRVITLVGRGLDFFGEDQVIVGRGNDGQWRVWPYWRFIMASAETTKLFPTAQNISGRPPTLNNKYIFEKIDEVLQVEKPSSALLTEIIKVIPGNENVMKSLEEHEAFREISSGFLHTLLPNSTPKVIDILLDIISEVPVHLVSWDMFEEFEKRQAS